MRLFSIRLFSPSGEPNGTLVASREDWLGRAVIFPWELSSEVKGRKEYQRLSCHIPDDHDDASESPATLQHHSLNFWVLHFRLESTQYSSIAFGNRCKEMGVRPSMGTVGDAYDNAMAESFFATLECELIARRKWETKAEARLAIFTWIEAWYNLRRRHSGLGQMSPCNFEKYHQEKKRQEIEQLQQPILTCPEAGLPTGCFTPEENPTMAIIHPESREIKV